MATSSFTKSVLGRINSPAQAPAQKPSSFKASSLLYKAPVDIRSAIKFVGQVGRGIARNIGSAGVTIARALKGQPKDEEVQFNIETAPKIMQKSLSFIFGKDPIKSIEQRITEAEPKVRIWGEQLSKSDNPTWKKLGDISKNNALSLSFIGVMGSVGLDLTPFGGGKKGLQEALIAAKNSGEAVSVLKKLGIADDLITHFADEAVKVANKTDADKLITRIAEIQKTTKVAKPVAEVLPKLDPLTQEAKIETKVTLRDNNRKVVEINIDGKNVANAIFDKDKTKTALGGTYHTPELRILDPKTGQRQSIRFVGADLETFTNPEKLRGILERENLIPKINAQKAVAEGVIEVPPIKPPVTPTAPIEEAGNTIQKLIKAIDEAVPLRADQKKLYSEELAKRTARVAQVGAKVEGEAGFFAQLGALKGELPKKSFEAIRGQFNQKEIDSLFTAIEQTKTLLPLEKVGTKGGLTKLFEGIVPTPSEIENLKEVFPKELIDSLLARRPLFERFKETLGNILNIPRTTMASTDLSAPLRQGIFMIGRPQRFAGAFKDMFKFAVSEKAYSGLIEGIKARPTYLKMKQGGLALTEIGGQISKKEEAFMGNLIEKVPLFGSLARGSNRAYTGFLNKLRADIFDDILTKAKIAGRDIDDPLLGSIADFVNAGTGRGKFGLAETGILPKSMERAAVAMNAVFFSPRLMASRLNLLNPYFYVQLDPLVRKEALKTLFATSGMLGSVYGLWKLGGGDVGLNPKSADFGKVKIGNTRYDLMGGFQQYIKLATQLVTGEIISSTTGRTITLGEGYKPLTRKEIVLRFFENKTSPIASFVIGLMTGQTATGEDVDVPTEVVNRFIPMVVQDLYDLSQEKGAEGILGGLPAIFGVGVQTYGKQEYVEGVNKLGEPTSQIRPVPELADKIRELVLGELPLGTSKGFSVETYFDQLQNLPREEAADIFDKISETNPELAKKLLDVVKERELGITVQDKDLKAKGVASGDRALAVKKELDKLETKEEKAQLWEEYTTKGIITKEVARQLLNLLSQ